MYNNLRAEMTRSNVTVQAVADLLDKTARTVRDKLMGRSDFTIGEFTKIHDTFFPALSLAYLSEKVSASDHPPDEQEGA